MFKFNRLTSQFVLDEGKEAPSLASYIQSLKEIVYSLSPRSKTEGRRIEIAKSHLREIKLYSSIPKSLWKKHFDMHEIRSKFGQIRTYERANF